LTISFKESAISGYSNTESENGREKKEKKKLRESKSQLFCIVPGLFSCA
jgi:hypothetical protein